MGINGVLCRAFKNLETTTTAIVESLSPLQTIELALKILQVDIVPQELANLLVSRSQGNPLFLIEILTEMMSQQVVR